MAFEFSRERIRFVKELGSGEFGDVWLAQAFGLAQLNPREETPQAIEDRQKLRAASTKKINKEFDNRVKTGRNIELAAIKRLKGEYLQSFLVISCLSHRGSFK